LNEIAGENGFQFSITEGSIPLKKEVRAITELLGVDAYSLACEGRFVCVCASADRDAILTALRKFNPLAACIGRVEEGSGVTLTTRFGKRILSMPSGNIVPRIC
jgi:hydrogenase expression/formation protein HypE